MWRSGGTCRGGRLLYDVPVKLFSDHLLLTALVLVTAGLKAQQGLTELAKYWADPANSQTRLQTRGFHPLSPVPFNR